MGGAIESRRNRKVFCRGVHRSFTVSLHLIQVRRQHLLIDLGLKFVAITIALQILHGSLCDSRPVFELLRRISRKLQIFLLISQLIETSVSALNIRL